MNHREFHYETYVEGLYFNESNTIELEIENSVQVKMTFTTLDEKVFDLITFKLNSSSSKKKSEVKKIGEEKMQDIINILAAKYGASFTKPICIYEEENGRQIMAASYMTLTNIKNIEINKKEIEDLKGSIKDGAYVNFLRTNTHQKIFREIIFSENNIGNFIALYSILHDIISDYGNEKGHGQGKVENFIKKFSEYWNPSEDLYNSFRKTTQTKYTWIRNKIGHTDLQTDMTDLEERVKEAYPQLIGLVQKAIEVYTK